MKKIVIISPGYPSKHKSTFTFVQQLIEEFALLGIECHVIAPHSITNNKSFLRDRVEHKECEGGGSITIYRPNYISFSNLRISSFRPSSWSFNRAVNRTLKKIGPNIDCIYGHFWASALAGYRYAKAHNIPLYTATGESVIPEYVVNKKNNNFYDYVSRVVCVSSKNLEESIQKGLTIREKCKVIPNAINPERFRLLDKEECRKKLNIPKDAFIVISVGWFSERKGTKRISDAIDKIQDGSINSIFIGKGTEEPSCENILFKGPVPHELIPIYLNASDVFVLPTLHEGCCNAVIEAMACGLPVISSDRSFNHDILDKENSILINPNDVDAIAEAILKIYKDSILRKKLSEKALLTASQLAINIRARRIIDFITK